VAAWFDDGMGATVLSAPEVEVTIDGVSRPRVWLDWIDEAFGCAPRAGFSVGLGRAVETSDEVRLETAAPTVRPGALVRARLLRGGLLPGASRGDVELFEGRVTRAEMALDAHGERLRFEAEDLAAEVLSRRVGGQRIRTADSQCRRVEGLDLVFNPDGLPNASEELYVPDSGDPYPAFAPVAPGGAGAWTVRTAVAYVLAEYAVEGALGLPSPGEVEQAVDEVPLRDIVLEGRTLGEALEALLEPMGGRLVVRADPGWGAVARRLELWRPERAATVRLANQPVGERFDPAATHFSALSFEARFDAAPRRYVARGDVRCYETTLDLVPGWNDGLAVPDPDAYHSALNPDFETVRDVYRKWVVNEAGDYSGPPYDRGPAPDLSVVFEGRPYVRRRRRLLACLSRDALERSRGVHVEASLDGGATWGRLSASARVLRDECGVYLSGDRLPAEYLAAAMAGLARLRATATIESDACLVAERTEPGAAALPGRTRYLSAGPGYRYRHVSASSLLGGGSADEVDDSARLQALVDAAAEADRRCPVPSLVRVPWLAPAYGVGQRVAGTRGRRLDLAREQTGFRTEPVVRRVRRRFAEAPATELELE